MSGNVPHLQETSLPRICQAIVDLFAGRSNAVGVCTLRANETTTTVPAVNCGLDSKVFLFPKSGSAATEVGNGTIFVSSIGRGEFTLTHANNAGTTRTFSWLAIG